MKQKMKLFLFDWKNRGWFVLNIFCTVMYLMWRIFFTIPLGYGWISVTIGIGLLIVEVLGMVEALVHYINMYNVRDYKKPDVPLELFPDVDVFISTYNEDVVLIAKTIYACKRMEYPDPNKVHIFLCDDGHREQMKQLARSLKIQYLDRETHDGQKAGNLNNALAHSSSPYIVTFDADMQPMSNFLMETIPYCVDAELRNKELPEEDRIPLGFIQTPQSFYDLDLFQFNLHSEDKIPNEQDYFYRDIEVSKTRSNSCIYGGSNTVISRKALEDIGGFYTDAITEDFATGILIQKKGYVSLGLGKPLASGMSAGGLQDLIQQRVRWARGVISTGRKLHIYTSKDLSFEQKMNYWASIWYWYAPIKRFFYIFSPIIYAVFGIMVFRCTLWQVLLFWLPMYVTSNMSLRMLSNNIRNTKWTSIYEYALFPFLLLPVILETFGITLKKFKVTKKEEYGTSTGGNIVYMVPFIILIVLSVIGIINCVRIIFDSGSMGPIVVLFWLLVNLYNMVMCIFFISGRKTYRKAERVSVCVPVTIFADDAEYHGMSKDVSETGAAIYLDKPHLLKNKAETPIEIEIKDRDYCVRLMCEIKFTKEEKADSYNWLYTLEFVGFASQNGYDNLLAICYDRVPTKPQELVKTEGMYADLSVNIGRRSLPSTYLKRHYPRIIMNHGIQYFVNDAKSENKEAESQNAVSKQTETQTVAGKEKKKLSMVQVADFNYQFISISGGSIGEHVTFVFGKYEIPATLQKTIKGFCLYEVVDFEKFYEDQEFCDAIMEYALQSSNHENDNNNGKKQKKGTTHKKFSELDFV